MTNLKNVSANNIAQSNRDSKSVFGKVELYPTVNQEHYPHSKSKTSVEIVKNFGSFEFDVPMFDIEGTAGKKF